MNETLIDEVAELKDASKGIRFATIIIDTIFLYIIQAVITIPIVLSTYNSDTQDIGISEVSLQIMGVFIWLLYYIILENANGKTLAKYLLKTKVVTVDGKKPTAGQIIGRTFSRIVPFEPFSFLGSKSTGWHDDWSKTRVIKE